jgi:outer membrane protein assembly factor BamB
VLYVFGTTKELYGLDSEDGRLLWTIDTGSDWATLAPLVVGEWIVVATSDSVDVYDRSSGALTLEHPQSRAISLAFHDGYIVSASANFISRVDPREQLPWWWDARGAWFQFWVWGLAPEPPRAGLDWLTPFPRQPGRQGPPPVVYAPAFSADAVVVANEDGAVRLLASATGQERWNIEVGEVTGAPVWTPSGILLPLRDALSVRSPADGAEIARQQLPAISSRSIVVTEGSVFLASVDGRISALRWP